MNPHVQTVSQNIECFQQRTIPHPEVEHQRIEPCRGNKELIKTSTDVLIYGIFSDLYLDSRKASPSAIRVGVAYDGAHLSSSVTSLVSKDDEQGGLVESSSVAVSLL